MAYRSSVEIDPIMLDESSFTSRNLPEDEEAFAALVRPYLQLFAIGIHRILQNAQDTQEALQAALISIHGELHRLLGHTKFRTWAYQICLNEALALRRSRMRQLDTNLTEFIPRPFGENLLLQPTALPARARPSGSCAETRSEPLAVRIRQEISGLVDDQRVVFILRDLEGMDTEDVARKLGITQALVRQRLHQARLFLRDIFANAAVYEAMA